MSALACTRFSVAGVATLMTVKAWSQRNASSARCLHVGHACTVTGWVVSTTLQWCAGAAGHPFQLDAPGMNSPFITSVRAPSFALSATTALYRTELRGPM